MTKSILQQLSLVDVFVGSVSSEVRAMSLSERVAYGLNHGAIDVSEFKQVANEHPELLLTILRLAGLGETGRRDDPVDAAYWQGVSDLAKTILHLAALEVTDADKPMETPD